MFKTMVLP